ncbi:MAG: HEPN domain-containing protein [Candidatus Aenigmarchaeota archaeon]|nr:HEPN domain-containing protein [Candidatus Aenigmarchaeota archaeon]MDI6722341.1 HEPN domain-containing protein [Candidatus Aenigmarchaeota archaeon]
MVRIYIERSGNEINAAECLKKLSEDAKLKQDFGLDTKLTFYSSVISHSYYSIFYAAKALLLTKDIRTDSPEIHKKTYDAFKKHFVDTGVLDVALLHIYSDLMIKADDLLEIFMEEKSKRGKFTYSTIPQANKSPAEDSIRHAKFFAANISKAIEK